MMPIWAFVWAGIQPATAVAEPTGEALARLEAAYGRASQDAFGSAVFHRHLAGDEGLAEASLAVYRHYVGALWQQYGEEAWLGPWRMVYRREPGVAAGIVQELRSIEDLDARLSVPMLLDVIENADAARAALSGVFDDPSISELLVFNLGDGGAMSGVLIAARNSRSEEATFLIFLMD